MRVKVLCDRWTTAWILAGGLSIASGFVPLLAIAQGALPPPPAVGAPADLRCTTPKDRGCIDWTRGVAIAVGTGVPASSATSPAAKNVTALRMARLDAARNLAELIRGVNLSSSSSVQQAMLSNDQVSSSVEATLNSIREVGDPRYFSDGSVQVRLETSLRQIIPTDLYLGPPREISGPNAPPAPTGPVAGGAYTGLIIDGRGTGVTPAMSPKVYDPEGKEVYGSAYVSREFAISQGIVGYVKSIEQAKGVADRIGNNPVMVKAQAAKGANKADLILSREDSDQLRQLAQQQTFLREARVMIVLD